MRQKLIISSALIHRPQCIVVDEPMVGLDPKAARLLKDIFRQFVGRGGTVLMSTHTLEVAGGDVRPRRDHPARENRRGRDCGRLATPAPRRRRQPERALPEAHGRRARART